jgi:hypothetical protein
MGLAIVNQTTCLPFACREACDLCIQECNAAGYNAIEYTQVGTIADDNGNPIDGTVYRALVVLRISALVAACARRGAMVSMSRKRDCSQSRP